MRSGGVVRAFAPGRVNLIGDHTDYSGGLVFPMAIELGTTVTFDRGGAHPDIVWLESDLDDEPARLAVGAELGDPRSISPPWARYVAGVVAIIRPGTGGSGTVRTTLPVGAGLSSSAALEVAVALALGFEGTALALAGACQQAEQLASGVPCGIMDQLCAVAGVAGCALRIDCTTLDVTPVPLPPDLEVVVVHSGEPRSLSSSAYAQRRAELEAGQAELGRALRDVGAEDVSSVSDAVARRRCRHVVSENARVESFGAALAAGDGQGAGRLMMESHTSLAEDFEVSTPALDALVARLDATPGVLGARLTGAGFGGCVVALVTAGAAARVAGDYPRAWVVRPSPGAFVSLG
jgi:galactokinase